MSSQLAYRTSREIQILRAAPLYSKLPSFISPTGEIKCCGYSGCGRFFAWSNEQNVIIINTEDGALFATLNLEHVLELAFSPKGGFLITWQRPHRAESGAAMKNLKVWSLSLNKASDDHMACTLIAEFVQKSATNWKFKYTADEKTCARLSTNEIQLFDCKDMQNIAGHLRLDGVNDFEFSQGAETFLASFVPERKGHPAYVKIFKPSCLSEALTQKSFYKCDKIQLKWNASGSSLIVLAQTEVDRSGKSYYGETSLYLMSTVGTEDARIGLDKEGPVHDVAWSPNAQHFGLIYGYMPAKARIYNSAGLPIHDFPLAPKNTMAFSPDGRFVLVAGFGNLAGQMDIYDCSNRYTKISSIIASNASFCQWSPDARHILTATTSPRLRVDNGLRLWHFDGSLVYNCDLQELYEVMWRPQPFSPENRVSDVAAAPHISALEFLKAARPASSSTAPYRPPGARGQVTPFAFRREDGGGAAYVSDGSFKTNNATLAFNSGIRGEIPGAAPMGTQLNQEKLSKTAAKNKKKREARKITASSSSPFDAGNPSSDLHIPGSPAVEASDKIDLQNSLPDTGPQIIESASGVNGSGSEPNVDEKRIRALLKKIRAIEDLRMRQAAGEKLEITQLSKIESEDDIRRELSLLDRNVC